MKQITININDGKYSIGSPYSETFVESIHLIDKQFRKWDKPYWLVEKNAMYHSKPVIEYLREVCTKAAAQQQIPFLDNSVELSPIEQIRIRANIQIERFKKLIAICNAVEPKSFILQIHHDGIEIGINRKIDSELYETIRSICDKQLHSTNFEFNLNDTEILRLWNNPAVSNPSLIELTMISNDNIDNKDVTVVAIDTNNQKYLCSKARFRFYNSTAAIIQGIPLNSISTDRITDHRRFLYDYGNDMNWADPIYRFHLEDDFIAKLTPPEQYLMSVLYEQKSDKYHAERYYHPEQQQITWFKNNAEKLIQMGVDYSKYAIVFAQNVEWQNNAAITAHREAIANAIPKAESMLQNTNTKEELLDWIENNLPTPVKKSWNKAKIVEALNIPQELAIKYLKIPNEPTLIKTS